MQDNAEVIESEVEETGEGTDTGIDIDSAFNALIKVFEFFQSIVDTLAGLMQPLFESLFGKLLGKE